MGLKKNFHHIEMLVFLNKIRLLIKKFVIFFNNLMMREKVRFYRTVLIPNSSGGSTAMESTVWEPQGAKVVEVRPSIDIIATQPNLDMLVKVECRYNPEIPILHGDKIEWRGFIFTSLKPRVDRIKRMMEIFAFSEIETSSRENETSSESETVIDGGNFGDESTGVIDGGSL